MFDGIDLVFAKELVRGGCVVQYVLFASLKLAGAGHTGASVKSRRESDGTGVDDAKASATGVMWSDTFQRTRRGRRPQGGREFVAVSSQFDADARRVVRHEAPRGQDGENR